MPDRGSVTENHYDHVHVSNELIIKNGSWVKTAHEKRRIRFPR